MSSAGPSIPPDSPWRLDRRAVRRNFDRASAQPLPEPAVIADTRRELLDRLGHFRCEPRTVLDLGCGAGAATGELKRRYRDALVVGLDLSFGMLRAARSRSRLFRRIERVLGEADRLPLASASVDLLFANLLLPWCDELGVVLAEMRRVMRAEGLLMLSFVGPDTLGELREAWAEADETHLHVHLFPDMHIVGDALAAAGFSEPVLDVERRILEYESAAALMRELKAAGAANAIHARSRGLTGRAKFRRLEAAYERRRRTGRLPATCEIVFAAAWAPESSRAARVIEGEARIPLDALRRRRTQGPERD